MQQSDIPSLKRDFREFASLLQADNYPSLGEISTWFYRNLGERWESHLVDVFPPLDISEEQTETLLLDIRKLPGVERVVFLTRADEREERLRLADGVLSLDGVSLDGFPIRFVLTVSGEDRAETVSDALKKMTLVENFRDPGPSVWAHIGYDRFIEFIDACS